MKVKFLSPVNAGTEVYPQGATADMPVLQAAELIACGAAESPAEVIVLQVDAPPAEVIVLQTTELPAWGATDLVEPVVKHNARTKG